MDGESYEELMLPLAMRFGAQARPPEEEAAVEVRPLRGSEPRDDVSRSYDLAQRKLRDDLLGYVHAQSHSAFERLIIDALLRMGYGSRRRDIERWIGKSHDGGVDGVIEQDELALDQIYIQAKRLRPGSSVPVSQVRDFVGSLEAKHADKGLFVTTGLFTASAHEFMRNVVRRVVLVSGPQLADIMIRHNIGVRVKETYQFKEVESSYFSSLPTKA